MVIWNDMIFNYRNGTGGAVGGDYREGKEQKDFVGRIKGFKPES